MAKEKLNTYLGEVCTLQLPKIATIERNFIASSFHSIIANRFLAKNRYRSLISSSLHLFIPSFLLLFITSSLVSSSLVAQIPAYVPTNGLLGYWPFNGNANDESGNGNHGTVNGATLTSDINNISNQSYSFDGVNDFISIGNIPVINGNNSRSFVAWVKINPGQNGGVIISQGAELFQSGCNQGFHFNATSALADCAYSGCGIITNCSQVRHPCLLNDGNWHQVAVTYSSGGYGGLAFYADGQFISTNPNNCIQGDQYSEFNTGSMFGVNFGKRNDEYFSNCTLDDIAIYNRALTPSEITTLYNGTTTIPGCTNNTACNYNATATQDDGSCTYPAQTYLNCAGTCINDADNDGTCDELETPTLPSYLPSNGLVGYWPFNGNANDESGNGNHGTVNGATLTADRNGSANSAYSFEDNNAIITATNNFPFGNESRTICVNVFSSNFSQLNKMIAGYGNDNPLQMFSVIMYNSCCLGQPAFWARDHDIPYQNALANNNWHQLCVTYNNNEIRTYYNAELNQIVDYSNTPLNTPNSLNFHIGNFNENVQGFFGIIDDIAIYNRALTQEEITTLYNGTTNTPIAGCTNTAACNYNAAATQDDGSCTYPAQAYLNCAGTCINDADNDGTCNELETPTLPSYLPSNGLVGYWPFNGNANDESGNGNHGTVNGATLSADRNGSANSAYGFDGISNFIYSNASLPISNSSRSISLWTKIETHTIDAGLIGWGNFSFYNYCAIGLSPTYGKTFFWTYGNDQTSNSTLNLNTWSNITVTYENSSSRAKFYINGNLDKDTILSNLATSNSILYFGKSLQNTSTFFNGSLDDIAIYNRALTQEEITALYNGTTNGGGGGNGGTAGTTAQSVPQGIPYQAMIRDNNGAALVNTPVTVRFSLRQDAIDGTVEYQETHNLTTNAFGLVNTHFGSGTATQSTFSNINWSNTTKFIQVEANTGSGFVEMGTQQMMSVPFALQANKATMIKNAGLPVYADNAAALAGGLVAGEMYRTATGDLKIVY